MSSHMRDVRQRSISSPAKKRPFLNETTKADLLSPSDPRSLRLGLWLAASASCSGDKSDKEESAGCFGAYGLWLTAALVPGAMPKTRRRPERLSHVLPHI